MVTNVLVVDDGPSFRASVKYMLERAGYRAEAASSGEEALKLLEQCPFDVALIDLKMARMDGLELLRRIRARWPDIPVILVTAYASIPSAVDAMKLGASHYLEKHELNKESLIETIRKACAEFGSQSDSSSEKSSPFANLVGSSAQFKDALEIAQRFAGTDKPVLVLGELGTGKESLARAIHDSSPRSAGPFVPFRCSAVGANADLELFGGTGVVPGRVLEAHAGTLYLDGIEDLPAATQASLVRFIRDGELPQSSSSSVDRSDARVIASSTLDQESLGSAGGLRQDLLLLLKGVTIRLPPLRQRPGDLQLLVQHFGNRYKARGAPTTRLNQDASRTLMSLPFLGNLKELGDLVEQATALAPSGEITNELLARLGIHAEQLEEADTSGMRDRIEQEERKAIEEELLRNPHNLKQTAKNLNISRTTLWRKMKKYGLEGR